MSHNTEVSENIAESPEFFNKPVGIVREMMHSYETGY